MRTKRTQIRQVEGSVPLKSRLKPSTSTSSSSASAVSLTTTLKRQVAPGRDSRPTKQVLRKLPPKTDSQSQGQTKQQCGTGTVGTTSNITTTTTSGSTTTKVAGNGNGDGGLGTKSSKAVSSDKLQTELKDGKKDEEAPSTGRQSKKDNNQSKTLPARSSDEKDKQSTISKELKNLDIQITGFSNVLNSDSNPSSSNDILIKASISEIVKTKSRASASQSIYGKSATVTANTPDKPSKSADQREENSVKSSKVESISKAENTKLKGKSQENKKMSSGEGPSKKNDKGTTAKSINSKKIPVVPTVTSGRSKSPEIEHIDQIQKLRSTSCVPPKKRLLPEKYLISNKKLKANETVDSHAVGNKDQKTTADQSKLDDVKPKASTVNRKSKANSNEDPSNDNSSVQQESDEKGKLKNPVDLLDKKKDTKETRKSPEKSVVPKKRAKTPITSKESAVDNTSSNVSPRNLPTELKTETSTFQKQSTESPKTKSNCVKKKYLKMVSKRSPTRQTTEKDEVEERNQVDSVLSKSKNLTRNDEPKAKASAKLSSPKPTIKKPLAKSATTKASKNSNKKEPIDELVRNQKIIDETPKSPGSPKKKGGKSGKIQEEKKFQDDSIKSKNTTNKSETTQDTLTDKIKVKSTSDLMSLMELDDVPLTIPVKTFPSICPQSDMPVIVSESLANLSLKQKKPKKSQSKIKKMVEDILQGLEMSDEFSPNPDDGDKHDDDKNSKDIDSGPEVDKFLTISTETKIKIEEKTIKVKSKIKKEETQLKKSPVQISETICKSEIKTEEFKEEFSSDDLQIDQLPLSALVKSDNSNIIIKQEKQEKVKKVIDSPKNKKKTKQQISITKIAPVIKRKYIRKKTKAASAAQLFRKLIEEAKRNSLKDLQIAQRKKADLKSNDVYDFHESGNSSEDASLSYKKKLKKDAKVEGKKQELKQKVLKDSKTKKATQSPKETKTENLTKKQKNKEESKGKDKDMKNAKTSKDAKEKEKNSKSVKVIKKKETPKSPKKVEKTGAQKKEGAKKSIKNSPKKNQIKKKPTTKKLKSEDTTNESEGTSSDNETKALQKKIYRKKNYTTDTTSDSESDSECESVASVTSVRTRVTKQRKVAVKNRRMHLYGFYSGPKRHRMASLNALAKVQCLYENESKTAQELGFVREPRVIPKPIPIPQLQETSPSVPVTVQSSDIDSEHEPIKNLIKDKKSGETVLKKEPSNGKEKEKDSEVIGSRSLRTAPGLRGAGKLWEIGNTSSMESNTDPGSDDSYSQNKSDKPKVKKKPLPKRTKSTKSGPSKATTEKQKPTKIAKSKTIKRSVSVKSTSSSECSDKNDDDVSCNRKKDRRKVPEKSEFKEMVVQKRMASLNASAMLAATYEVERHFDRCDSIYNGSLSDSPSERTETPKKIEKIKDEIEESRPVSTNVVIVQDTDVTITGVYVNSSLGSSQEAYCKMQYRVQSSVTEERLVRPSPQEPPKSYTPLSALSCMLPPGSNESGGTTDTQPSSVLHQQQQFAHHQHLSPQQHHHHSHHPQQQQHHPQNTQFAPPPSSSLQSQSHHSTIPMHYKSPPDCDSPPYRYQSVYQAPSAPPGPPPPSDSSSIVHSSSAFCAIPPSHHDTGTGYYQPAGPLISSHLVSQSQQGSTKSIPSPLDSDSVQLQQPPQSTSAAESSDSEVLITGADLTPRPQTFRYAPQVPGPYSRPMHQMHCSTYPPASYYTTYSQHPQDMCYSPPYQPYYPSKVYPTSYRRYVTAGSYYQPTPTDMYDPPPPSSAPPPPPSGTQIVPSGPSGPQHMDHYPYYSGYSPGGGGGGGGGGGHCYNRSMQPPYMDAPQYQNSCPCPMQSCPKNVLTGPLIGSKTGKGPVQSSNHLPATAMIPSAAAAAIIKPTAPHEPSLTTVTSTNANVGGLMTSINLQSSSGKVTCKTEDGGSLIIKPEIDLYMHHSVPSVIDHQSSIGGLDRVQDKPYEKIVHAPHPNFSLNPKMLEPETSVSPARGSIGLPMPPTQDSATQPPPALDVPVIRRARVGKSMAREMVMMSHTTNHNHLQHSQTTNFNNNNTSQKGNLDQSTTVLPMVKEQLHTISVKPEINLIKQEDMKVERDDDVVLLDTKCSVTTDPLRERINSESETISSCDNIIIDKSDEPEIITIDDSLEDYLPIINTKKRKILESHKHTCKKSPPNSYKSLIKQSEPKPYLCTPTNGQTPIRSRYRILRSRPRLVSRPRKILISRKNRKFLITSSKRLKRRIRQIRRNNHRNQEHHTNRLPMQDHKCKSDQSGQTETDNDIEIVKLGSNTEKTEVKETTMTSSMDLNGTDSLSIVTSTSCSSSSTSSFSPTSTDDGSSKSTKPSEKQSKLKKSKKESNDPEQSDLIKSSNRTRDRSKSTSKSKERKSVSDKQTSKCQELKTANAKSKKNSKCKKSGKNEVDGIQDDEANDVSDEKLLDNDSINNNNNSIIIDDYYDKSHSSTTIPKTSTNKRSRSRAIKFGNKKRHRVRHVPEIEEIVIPRKSTAQPRWSNGWSWVGQPFQGKVFLNSDDPQVGRTRYPAMRHVSGDVVRPGDCVLLKAGSKKNELPYVAKVASLWENPEDGEMMMSLLWYYRPEHTEQGRQPTDCTDEVFASRHQDHNSVACIEDKCYVLTFNEYCRYRKSIKALEEGVEEPTPIPPPLRHLSRRPEVPSNAASELIFFCRRVYEFRLKRLIKNPS